METDVGKTLLENAIGRLAVNYLETLQPDVIIPVMEARAPWSIKKRTACAVRFSYCPYAILASHFRS